ncbi:hypothetical protein JET56_21285, partial [Escherichia coli]|nr:hypothetical protein [Escherichia coli]MBW0618361.1 hypothetical protein [Escherichia coli]HAV9013987.1 hypothetical protein [Escherichia coli]
MNRIYRVIWNCTL